MEKEIISLLSQFKPIFKQWVKEAQAEIQPSQAEPENQLLTIDEASKYLSLSKATCYSLVSKNRIPYMKRAKRLYFSKSELLDYIREGRQKTASEKQQEAGSYLKNAKGGAKNG